MKACSKCKEPKLDVEFHKNPARKDGLQHYCKKCRSSLRKNYYNFNRNRELFLNKCWYSDNPYYASFSVTNRRAALAKRTPKWADSDKIRKIYEEAAEFREGGIEVSVDHIIPLRGKNVSGLHVHDNLRIILSSHNSSKGNKWES